MPAEYLEFEKPIAELEKKIEELTLFTSNGNIDLEEEILKLQKKSDQLLAEIYSRLSPWQKVQISRHANRPYTLDYIEAMLTDFTEMHGDRGFADDPAIVCGMAKLDGMSVVIIGHQKGRTLKERVHRNFGQPNPEGYRKALRALNEQPPLPGRLFHPHEVLAIEDSPAGLAAAADLGLVTLGIAHTYPVQHLERADAVLPALAGVTLARLQSLFAEVSRL